jgi:hypothetical protein
MYLPLKLVDLEIGITKRSRDKITLRQVRGWSNSLGFAVGPAPAAGLAPAVEGWGAKPQPRSGRYVTAQIQRNGHRACSLNPAHSPGA